MGFEQQPVAEPSDERAPVEKETHESSEEDVARLLSGVYSISGLMSALSELKNVPASDGRRMDTDMMVQVLKKALDLRYVAPEAITERAKEFWASHEMNFTRVGGIREKAKQLIEELVAEHTGSISIHESNEERKNLKKQYETASKWIETGEKIKVLRSSGVVEDTWMATVVSPWKESWKTASDIRVLVTNGETMKRVPLDELLSWQDM